MSTTGHNEGHLHCNPYFCRTFEFQKGICCIRQPLQEKVMETAPPSHLFLTEEGTRTPEQPCVKQRQLVIKQKCSTAKKHTLSGTGTSRRPKSPFRGRSTGWTQTKHQDQKTHLPRQRSLAPLHFLSHPVVHNMYVLNNITAAVNPLTGAGAMKGSFAQKNRMSF